MRRANKCLLNHLIFGEDWISYVDQSLQIYMCMYVFDRINHSFCFIVSLFLIWKYLFYRIFAWVDTYLRDGLYVSPLYVSENKNRWNYASVSFLTMSTSMYMQMFVVCLRMRGTDIKGKYLLSSLDFFFSFLNTRQWRFFKHF